MPTTITPYLLGVWFCVGLFTALGWHLGALLIARSFGRLF